MNVSRQHLYRDFVPVLHESCHDLFLRANTCGPEEVQNPPWGSGKTVPANLLRILWFPLNGLMCTSTESGIRNPALLLSHVYRLPFNRLLTKSTVIRVRAPKCQAKIEAVKDHHIQMKPLSLLS